MIQINIDDPGQVGLRILARWIAEDLLKKQAKITSPEVSDVSLKEIKDANQRN